MSDVAIRVEHLSKMYKLYNKPSDRLREALGMKVKVREHYALRDLNFEVRRGETVGIIGTNGSGKSTVLKIITGVVSPTRGQVKVDGRISALLELGAGFNMEYSGLENVYLNGTMIGFTKEEIDSKLDDILNFADIGDFVYQPVKSYSSGMFVRLAFAVAINIDPDILIVDEALSVGDVFFQAKCYRKFEDFKRQGKTIVFVSHDLNSISRYCDRVILLNKGDILDEGEPKKIVDLYKKILVQREETPEEEEQDPGPEKLQSGTKFVRPFPRNPEVLEYGDKEAEIVDFTLEDARGVPTNTIQKFESFTIRMKVHFHEDIDEVIYAFTIKDMRGTEITGTNTMFEKIPVEPQKKGNTQIISFRQRMNLQGGEYLLSLGCTGYKSGEFTAFHRLYDVCSITVVATKNSVGFYDMDSRISVAYDGGGQQNEK
ncbi:MAG: ABC transporter ATP-binding protein [Lachnospiraceae bacterium]|nr:ABC transporter ATP-binding protein [Lachnospiraceae bacterium]